MKTILLIILLTLSSTAKDYDCKKLLKRAISDLNYANKHKHISTASYYSLRGNFNLDMFSLCAELDEDLNVEKIKKMLEKLK